MIRRTIPLLLALLAAAAPALSQGAPDGGRIVGNVVDGATRQPLSGASVQVLGTDVGTLTDADGRFSLVGIATGTHSLQVAYLGYATVHQSDVVVTSAQPTQVRVEMAPSALAIEGIVVRSFFSVQPGVVTSSYDIGAEEIRRAPGALGDVGRLIQALPGVVPTSDQRNDLVVRGGSPIENLTLVDNVEIPNLSHFNAQGASGGPISMLNTDLILSADFLSGAFPAQHGNRISSVLDISLREGNRDRFASSLDLGFAGAGAILEGPLGEKGSWLATAKRSYLDLIIGSVGFTAVPKFSNYQVKLAYDVNPRNKVWLLGLGGIDDIHFKVDEEDTEDPSLLDIQSGGWRAIHGFNWQTLLGDSGYGVLGVSDVYGAHDQTVHDAELDDRLVFFNDSRERETTVKYDLSYRLERVGEVRIGLSTKRFGTSFEIDQPLGAQNPYSTEAPRTEPRSISDETSAFLTAGYVQVARALASRLEGSAGVRYSHFSYSGHSTVSPQAGLKYQLRGNLAWNTSVGRYHQVPPLVYLRADPTNASLKPIRADHFVTGLGWFPVPDLRVGTEVYLKRYADYPVSAEHPTLSLANAGDEFNVAGLLMPYRSEGSGRSMGLEFHLQKKLTDRSYGQLSYSLSRSHHEALDGVRRPSSFDIPNVLSVIAGFKPTASWELSGRFTFASGRPYTPLDLALSRAQNRPILDLAAVNAERSPAYHRFDLHAERRHNFARWAIVGFLDIQNVYNRKNVFQYVWNPKTRERVAVNQIAFLPVAGFLIEF